jgi:hypothetical protein
VSALPVRLIDPAGQPARVGVVQDVSALPSVWDLTSTIEWLVDDLIPPASVHLISAESGTGKTWLAYSIEKGRGAAKLYTAIDRPRVPDLPNPREEKLRKSDGGST